MGLILESLQVEALVKGTYHGDPFAVLGMHQGADYEGKNYLYIRTLQPQAKKVEVIRLDTGENLGEMRRVHSHGLFQMDLKDELSFFPYRFKIKKKFREKKLFPLFLQVVKSGVGFTRQLFIH